MIADAVILTLPKVFLQAKQILPDYSGIYYVLDENNNVWYIGKAKNIRKRWQGKAHHRIYQLEAQKRKHFTIYYEQVSETQLDNIEKQRIEKYHPHLNASSVKTKKVRPTETLLRETIAAIADFAFIVGVEPPRKEMQSQTGINWLLQKKLLGLNVIHINLDLPALNKTFNPDVEEHDALIKTPFITRKTYAQKWESFPRFYSFMYRLLVNGYIVEVNSLNSSLGQEARQLLEYTQTTLAEESIKVLTPESLVNIQEQLDREKPFAAHFTRLNPYTSDLIKPVFNESIDRNTAKQLLSKLSEDYKTGRRGFNSRSKVINIDELFASRGIDTNKYARGEVKYLPQNRMGLYVKCFTVDLKTPIQNTKTESSNQVHTYNPAYGMFDDKKVLTASNQFNTVYLLVSVERKAWLLFEEYLKDFAKPANKLNNGEGYVEKFSISARKYIVPAKVNIKLENIGYSAWIPFGLSEEFPTFETATKEIRRRLQDSDLPELKITFKRETIAK